MTVAALYVDPKGVYADADDVDLWDEARDARLYAGPWPVVAHPPCARWSIMGQCRGYRDGQDGGCFAAALNAVRTFGGILEHPAHSLAWRTHGLPMPPPVGWQGAIGDPGWSAAVDQRLYGHEARKPTWLYYVGNQPPALLWGRGERGERTIGRSAAQGLGVWRSRTPPAFRDVLLAAAGRTTAPPLDRPPALHVGSAANEGTPDSELSAASQQREGGCRLWADRAEAGQGANTSAERLAEHVK